MSAPRHVDCRCTHPKTAHEALAPQCSARGCTCLQYRPGAAIVRPTNPAPGGSIAVRPGMTLSTLDPTVEQTLMAAKRSGSKRTAALGERITALVSELRGRLADERRHAEQQRREEEQRSVARAEVERLERQLAAAKAKLTKSRTTPSPLPANDAHPCTRDGCDRTFATSQSRALHERRAHDGFNPHAKAAG